MALLLYGGYRLWNVVCGYAFLWISQLFQNETTYDVFWGWGTANTCPTSISRHTIYGYIGTDGLSIALFFGMFGRDFSNFEPEI